MEIRTVRTEGLGDSTHVLIHDGVAVVVDPQLDFDRFTKVVEESGASPRFVLETHVHNDYLSGGRAMANQLGAELVFPAGAAPVFRHRPAFHHEDLDAGAFTIRPLHTPGHTPEHTSYLMVMEGRPVAVFSGGSLLVGSAGRTDLLGQERAETLARLQYGSVTRLAALPGEVGLYPTHGAGSFCTVSRAGSDTSTIGDERESNPALAHDDEETFVAAHLSGLVPFPSYYARMAPANLAGPEPPDGFQIRELSPEDLADLSDSIVVDARPRTRFAEGHLPGAISIELKSDFSVWAAWVLSPDANLVLILDPDQDAEEARRQLARVGMDRVAGVLRWDDEVGATAIAYRTVDVAQFADAVISGAQVLDTRAPDEWDEGVIASSTLAYAPDVARGTPLDIDPDREVWIACGSGYRASIAASFLEKRGIEPVLLDHGGIGRVLKLLTERGATEWHANPSNGGR